MNIGNGGGEFVLGEVYPLVSGNIDDIMLEFCSGGNCFRNPEFNFILSKTLENSLPGITEGFHPDAHRIPAVFPCGRKTMKTLFVPGCALMKYKPGRIADISRFLREKSMMDDLWMPCCKSDRRLTERVSLITCCPGCSHQFQMLYPDFPVLSLWKVLADSDFPFPDYHGARMSIHDSCSARNRRSFEMQDSVRWLCGRMNIQLVEPEWTKAAARCCGGSATDPESRRKMALRRAGEFPEKNVVVYCTGCVRSFSITEVIPRHILDLLYKEPTEGLYPPGYEKSPAVH